MSRIDRDAVLVAVRRLLPYLLAAACGMLMGVWACPASGPREPAPEPMVTPVDSVHAPPTAFDWAAQPEAAFPMPPYAAHLRGARIVLDPGHGGRKDTMPPTWKRGPTGLREAEVNLRVALALRVFLQAAGADVMLTRDADTFLASGMSDDLRSRIQMANDLRADLFLSIHHNGSESPQPNYTTVFYHGKPDHSPASLDAARFVLQGLQDALRLDSHLPLGLMSDYEIYPGKGFAVLRQATVPAVLSEASFHSNPEEEARLRDPLYNRREAYGLFLGLARWAQAGLPMVHIIEPRGGIVRAGEELDIRLDDGLTERGGWGAGQPKIIERSLAVRWDDAAIASEVDFIRKRLRVRVPTQAAPGVHELLVDFRTLTGQHVLRPRFAVRVRP